MAVVPMKLVTIAGPLSEFDSVVYSYIINQQFHPESTTNVIKNIKFLYPFEQQNPYADLLRQAESMADRMEIELAYRSFESMNFSPDKSFLFLKDLEARYQALIDERTALTQRITDNERIRMQLQHITDVNVPLQDFFTVTYVKFRFGRMPRETYNNFIAHLMERSDLFFFLTSLERDWVYGMYMTTRASAEKADSLMGSLQFQRIRISSRVKGTGEEAFREVTLDTERAEYRLEEIKSELRILADTEKERFLRCYSYARFMNDSFNIRRYAAHTEESFYLLGWVPEPDYPAFTAQFEKQRSLTVVVVADDPDAVVEYTPPIKLKNPRIFRPFEPYLAMYGLPSYNEIDPTPLMAILYTLLFGIMFGDAGQGALLVVTGLIMKFVKKMWLGPIVCYAGVSSIFFGLFVYGSVFGFEHWLPGFKILESAENNRLGLQMAIYLGVALLTVSFITNIINGIRQKSPLKSLLGPNALAGLILYLAIQAIVLPILGFAENLFPTGLLVGLAAFPLVLIFLREPLAHLIKYRSFWKPPGVVDYVLENVFELIEILLSYVTNTISFLRVGAYAISHASMMSVVFMLAGAHEGEGGNLVVILLGNLLVMGIEGLLVGIQVLRLHFYEIFSRFYAAEGRPYSPIIIDYHAHHN
ncbi:MAG: ATPase V [Oscillospiraceae bacterium]|nr:ATPase V [Oscillospiraceae bacterium]